MSSETSDKFTCFSIPEFYGFVKTRACNVKSIGRKLYRYDQSLMSIQPCDCFVSLFWLPHYHSVVIWARDQLFTLGIARFVVSLKSIFLLLRWCRQTVVFTGVIKWSSLKNVLSTECQCVNPVSMSFEIIQQDSLVFVPYFYSSVLTCGVEHAFTTPEDFGDGAGVTTQDS